MATVGDAGITEGGNFTKPAYMVENRRVFEITNAVRREADKNIDKPQVNLTVRFLDTENDDDYTTVSLSWNDVRARYVAYFATNTEPIRGVKRDLGERGLVMYRATGGGKNGNPPILFRDATDDEANAVFAGSTDDLYAYVKPKDGETRSNGNADDIPF